MTIRGLLSFAAICLFLLSACVAPSSTPIPAPTSLTIEHESTSPMTTTLTTESGPTSPLTTTLTTEPESTPDQVVLHVDVNPPEGGAVNPGEGTYPSGPMVYLVATPSPGYHFVNWSGDVPTKIMMSQDIWIPTDRDRTVTANFEPMEISAPGPLVLKMNVDPPGGGKVSPSGGTYDPGTKVTLAATPSQGYRFVSWSGEVQSTSQTVTVPIYCDWNLQAHFELITTPDTRNTKIQILSPLNNERFVAGETVQFEATVTSDPPIDGAQLQWTSNLDGNLGDGPLLSTSGLSVGTHKVTVSGYGMSETFPVRIFADLGDFYRSPPAKDEIERILSHFTFVWENGSGSDESWSSYDSFIFDQNSTDPSKIVIVSKLDVMRHQRFSEPLPMTNGETIYDHLRSNVNTIRVRLDCFPSTGGDGVISLVRSVSVWDARTSNACKIPFDPPEFWPYVYALQLFVHEGRHCEPGDPGHVDAGMRDYQLEGGSGYAWGALYEMWVYKYSLYDPSNMREVARQEATLLLGNRFSVMPTHSDPRVQAIIQDLLGQ